VPAKQGRLISDLCADERTRETEMGRRHARRVKEIVKQPLLSTRQTEECADVGLDLAQLGGGDPVRCQDLLPLSTVVAFARTPSWRAAASRRRPAATRRRSATSSPGCPPDSPVSVRSGARSCFVTTAHRAMANPSRADPRVRPGRALFLAPWTATCRLARYGMDTTIQTSGNAGRCTHDLQSNITRRGVR